MTKTPAEMFAEKQKAIKNRGSQIDIGMGVGNALTNACNIVVALIGQDPSKSLDEKEIEEQIKKWVNKIYKIGQDKKDYEMVPVVEDIEIIPVKEGDPLSPKDYQKRSKEDDILREEKEGQIPF